LKEQLQVAGAFVNSLHGLCAMDPFLLTENQFPFISASKRFLMTQIPNRIADDPEQENFRGGSTV